MLVVVPTDDAELNDPRLAVSCLQVVVVVELVVLDLEGA